MGAVCQAGRSRSPDTTLTFFKVGHRTAVTAIECHCRDADVNADDADGADEADEADDADADAGADADVDAVWRGHACIA